MTLEIKSTDTYINRANPYAASCAGVCDEDPRLFLRLHKRALMDCLDHFPVREPQFFARDDTFVILLEECDGASIFDLAQIEIALSEYFRRNFHVIFRARTDDVSLRRIMNTCERLEG